MNKFFVAATSLLLIDIAHSTGSDSRGGGRSGSQSGSGRGGQSGGGGAGGARGGGGSSPSGSSADVYGFCVDSSTWSVSYDGGISYTEMYPNGDTDGWSSLTEFSIGPITAETQLIVNCTHSGTRMLDYNGLFIASITFEGEDYFTSDPLSDSLWQCTGSSTGGDTEITVYCPKTGFAGDQCLDWNPNVDEINEDADWWWNDENENTLTFAFDFGDIPGVAVIAEEQDVDITANTAGLYADIGLFQQKAVWWKQSQVMVLAALVVMALVGSIAYHRARTIKQSEGYELF